ncbi:MAG: hypothetical protein ACKVS8_11155 [Phycisphaerales bacterium]
MLLSRRNYTVALASLAALACSATLVWRGAQADVLTVEPLMREPFVSLRAAAMPEGAVARDVSVWLKRRQGTVDFLKTRIGGFAYKDFKTAQPSEGTRLVVSSLAEFDAADLTRVVLMLPAEPRKDLADAMMLVDEQEVELCDSISKRVPDNWRELMQDWALRRSLLELDLAAKISLLKESQAVMLRVCVNTLDGKVMEQRLAPRPAYFVWWVDKFWENDPSRYKRSDQRSSPCQPEISGGDKVLWVGGADKASPTGSKVPKTITGRMGPIDLDIPAAAWGAPPPKEIPPLCR